MPKRTRRHYTTEQKVAALRRHMIDKVPVSEICNELGLQPSVFYQWQRHVFENLAGALAPSGGGSAASKREKELASEVAKLKARLGKRDEVIAEISAEYVQLKKELGEP
jgi:transposase